MELKDFAAVSFIQKYKNIFQYSDKHVATDGRWLAWKADCTPITNPEAKGPELTDDYFFDFNPTQDLPEITLENCADCKGKGVCEGNVECDECSGGYTECGECGNDKECDVCEGSGLVSKDGEACDECNGCKYVETTIDFEGGTFSANRFKQLKDSGAKVCLLKHTKFPNSKFVGFKIGDITGYLMGVTK